MAACPNGLGANFISSFKVVQLHSPLLEVTMRNILTQRHVLVLNKLWTAIHVVTLKRAITMLWAEKAIIIDPSEAFATYTWDDWAKLRLKDGEDSIHTVRQKFKIPEVILLTDYDKMPRRQVKFSRRMIHKRDNYTCQYCGVQPGTEELTLDHIVSRARGGLTTWTNTVSACRGCNVKKGHRSLEEVRMKLLRQPKKPEFALFKVEKQFVCKSWRHFVDKMVSEAYWSCELENDNPR
jgi:5-methylcytosine-specific restriction endonuclease McrA